MKQLDFKQRLYFEMARIRHAEMEIARRYPEQEMRCPTHLSVGQEATPVGVVASLSSKDEMVSTHRGHAHYLAKGGSLRGLICELYGKKEGCAGGHGGSMHLIDRSVGFLGATSIVGGTIPIGVGAAFANRLQGDDRVVVVCIGDTAVEEGVFHESMNFAALHKLNVFFCCENNFYSCFSPLQNRQPTRPLTDVAKAHGMRTITADGNDVFDVYQATKAGLESVRRGEGPLFGEFKTYRWLEHCGHAEDDNLGYRPAEEVAYWKERDPLKITQKQLEESGLWSESFRQWVETTLAEEVEAVFRFAKEKASIPPMNELGGLVYAP